MLIDNCPLSIHDILRTDNILNGMFLTTYPDSMLFAKQDELTISCEKIAQHFNKYSIIQNGIKLNFLNDVDFSKEIIAIRKKANRKGLHQVWLYRK